MVPLANEQTLRKINTAVSRTMAAVPPQVNPSAELAKQASAAGVPAGFIDHLTHVFNVHRSLDFFEKQADRRYESFELADPDQVKDNWDISTGVAKAASIGPESDFAPIEFPRPDEPELALWDKMAGQRDASDTLVVHKCEKLDKQIKAERRRIATKRAHLRMQLEAGLDDLCRYFRLPGGESFDVVEQRTLCKYGSDAAPLLDMVFDLGELHRFNCKRASLSRTPRVFPLDRQPYPKIAALMELGRQLAEHERFAAHQTQVLDKAAADLSKILMGGIMGKQMGRDKPAAPVEDGPSNISIKPAVETELRNIQVSRLLTQLINDDPVISTYPAQEVANQFNQIASNYPRLAMNSPVVTEILRKRLQQAGGLDVFEGGKMLEQEDILRKHEQ